MPELSHYYRISQNAPLGVTWSLEIWKLFRTTFYPLSRVPRYTSGRRGRVVPHTLAPPGREDCLRPAAWPRPSAGPGRMPRPTTCPRAHSGLVRAPIVARDRSRGIPRRPTTRAAGASGAGLSACAGRASCAPHCGHVGVGRRRFRRPAGASRPPVAATWSAQSGPFTAAAPTLLSLAATGAAPPDADMMCATKTGLMV